MIHENIASTYVITTVSSLYPPPSKAYTRNCIKRPFSMIIVSAARSDIVQVPSPRLSLHHSGRHAGCRRLCQNISCIACVYNPRRPGIFQAPRCPNRFCSQFRCLHRTATLCQLTLELMHKGVGGDEGKGEGRHVLTTWHSQYVISFVMSTDFPFVTSSVTAITESSFVTSLVILAIDFDCVNSC
jgi:hypothetical protein